MVYKSSNIGLSLCIPIWNWDATQLVRQLISQAKRTGLPFELIAIDDFSSTYIEENATISKMENAKFIRLNTNAGRARTRNLLIKKASYSNVIMMDCDAAIIDSKFIERYVERIDKDLVVGGCAYQDKPSNPSMMLRWKYGKEREEKSAEERISSGSMIFSTFNFMAKREVLLNHLYDESICGYGHEDTLFALNISKVNISITHIDNALYHLGLDPAEIFLEKTKSSVLNLKKIYASNKDNELLRNEIRLLKYYERIKRLGLATVFRKTYSMTEPFIKRNLLGENPSIFALDVFKLGELCKE